MGSSADGPRRASDDIVLRPDVDSDAAASGTDTHSARSAASASSSHDAADHATGAPAANAETAKADPDHEVSQGLGQPPATPIATLPPIPPHSGDVVVSSKTGEPARRHSIIASQVALWAGALFSAIGYAWYWFQAMHKGQFHTASWVTGWLQPRPGGLWSILLVCGLAAVIATMVALPGVTAYQAWTGRRFSRTLAWWSLGASLLGVLFGWWAVASIPCMVIGIIALRARSSSDYFNEWDRFTAPAPTPEMPVDIFYGPLPRFQ